jgi:spore maturation protein CgeB
MAENIKVLFFTEAYGTLVPVFTDCKKALQKLGCEVMSISPQTSPSEMKSVLATLKPDFALSLNHAGIQEEVFNEAKIPTFSWLLDNPLYLLSEAHKAPLTYLLVLDKDALKTLKAFGFQNSFFLAPAASPERMHVMEHLDARPMDISFVESLGRRHADWRKERNAEAKPPTREILELLVLLKIQNPQMTFDKMFQLCDEKFKGNILQSLDLKSRSSIEYRVDKEVTSYFKEAYLLSLKGLSTTIFGDTAWKPVIPESHYFAGPINYANDAGNIYRMSKVNLHVSPAWMTGGIDDRILDIAATGALFLTDKRDSLQDFFDCDIRFLMYESENDLREKADYYLKSDEIRTMVGNDLFDSIFRRHTYDQRMQELLDIFKQVKKQ